MTKLRVYELAKELGVDNRELVMKIASLGIQARNHMSALDPLDADRIRRALEREKSENLVEERIRPTVVRRRSVAKTEETPPEPVVARPSPVVRTPAPPPVVEERADEVVGPAAPAVAAPVVEAAPEPVVVREETPPPPPPAPVQRPQVVDAPIRPSQPPPASVRLAHANLPPGVIARGQDVAPSAPPPSASTVERIVSQHAPRTTGDAPRRYELGRAALGQTGRVQQRARPGKKLQPPGKKGVPTQITTPSAQKRVIRIEDQVQLQSLAQRMSLKATDVLMKLMQLGMGGVNINSTLDADTAKILASEFGYEVENVAKSDEDLISAARGTFADAESDRGERAPIVTVMGHVDHGKTSLLDTIRSANVASGEAGGITQHIGAYRVDTPRGPIVFLDTPGHEAFTSMRARGAQATDLVILVVAADDGVMPQTIEAINHAKAAGVPIIVAVNKIDKPDARPEVIRRDLANYGLQPEEWGGATMFVDVSAKARTNIDTLLESVLLQAEMLELSANATIPGEGVVLEAYLDRGRGPVANVLIRNGTLNVGDHVVAGGAWGKVRALTDDRGKQVELAPPATPVEVLGLSEMPSAGDAFYVVTDAKKAQEIAASRKKTTGVKPVTSSAKVGLDQIYQMMQSGEVLELKLVVKADVQGSVEAIVKALTDLSTDKVKVNVIHTGVGGITENDVMLASASSAIIVGFNVRPAGGAAATAKSESVDVRLYSIIYEAVDEVKKAMAGLLKPTLVEKQLGTAEVRQVFSIPKIGTIAGCFVTNGKVQRNAHVRLVRDSVKVWEGQIGSLRRFKDDARDVAAGYECGIGLAGYNDVKERDIIECFEMQEVAATL